MVARLKLKGIDGRAPPGVNDSCLALAPVAWKQAASHTTICGLKTCSMGVATSSNCWEALKLLHTKACWKQLAGQVNDLGYGDNCSR